MKNVDTARYRTQNVIWLMLFAYWLDTSGDEQSEYGQLVAFQHQQFLHNVTTMLPLYIHCPSCFASVLAKHVVYLI
jgi:hypothetical protein